jgi:hypothetical protein
VEVVRIPKAMEGRYRVGVDYPVSCSGRRDTQPFAIAVAIANGLMLREGSVYTLEFDPVAFEFTLPLDR